METFRLISTPGTVQVLDGNLDFAKALFRKMGFKVQGNTVSGDGLSLRLVIIQTDYMFPETRQRISIATEKPESSAIILSDWIRATFAVGPALFAIEDDGFRATFSFIDTPLLFTKKAP